MKYFAIKFCLLAVFGVFAFVARAEDESTDITMVIKVNASGLGDNVGSFVSSDTEVGKGVKFIHTNIGENDKTNFEKEIAFSPQQALIGTFFRIFSLESTFKLSLEEDNPYKITSVEIKGYEHSTEHTLTANDETIFTKQKSDYIVFNMPGINSQISYNSIDYKADFDKVSEINLDYVPDNLPAHKYDFGLGITEIIVTLYKDETGPMKVNNYTEWSKYESGREIIFKNSLKVVAQDADKKWLMISDPESDKAIVAKFDTPITETFYPGEMLAPGLSGIKSADGTLMVDSERVASFKNTRLEPAPMSLSELTAENIGDYVYVTNYVLPSANKSLKSSTNIAFNNALNIDIPASHNVIDFYGLVGGTETELNIMPVQILRSIYTSAENVVASTVSIMTQPGMIIVNGECGQVQVYDTNGRVISKGEKQIPCSSGIYVVKADNQAQVVQVK